MAETDISKMKFEQAIKELEDTIKKLEGGELPLDEAVALFERGVGLSRRCSSLLDEAQKKISMLAIDDDEQIRKSDFPEVSGS